MEEAEHALWREAGLSIAPAGRAVGFPRVSASFDFHSPLRFEDECDVAIRIAAIADKSIRYACEISRGDDRIATGAITVVCVSLQPGGAMKAVSIPLDIVSRFAVAPGTPA
jgi:acyl-CoA thioesterase FadM